MAGGIALPPEVSISELVHVLDLVGTFAFAITGAMAGVRRQFDFFGVLVLAVVTAVAGGITRDVLIGAVPPAALVRWEYLALALLAGVLTLRFHAVLARLNHPVLVFDAAGLATFAVVGTEKALAYGVIWPMAAVLGMVSAIGGGMLRDMLSARVPVVLHAEIYAVAALAGALVVAIGSLLSWPAELFIATGAVLSFALRLAGIHRGWKLPAPR